MPYPDMCTHVNVTLTAIIVTSAGKRNLEASTPPNWEGKQETSQDKQQSITLQMAQVSGAIGNLCAAISPPQNIQDILPRALECQGTPKQSTKHSTPNEANQRSTRNLCATTPSPQRRIPRIVFYRGRSNAKAPQKKTAKRSTAN